MSRTLHIRMIRVLYAYFLAARIFVHYLWLARFRRWMGEDKYQQRQKRRHLKSARQIRNGIVRLNGLFIKVGQGISAMGMLLPAAYVEILEEMQDRAPGSSLAEVQRSIEKAFGKAPDELFAVFEKEPVASASIAQVHKAKLPTGEWVAVKVKHAHIDRIAAIDLAIIRRLTSIGGKLIRIEGMDHVYSQISQLVARELDFQCELEAQQHLADLLASEKALSIPEIYHDYCSASVLTTHWHEGVKVSKVNQITSWGLDPTQIARRIVRLYCVMLFEHGYYHADPHPGNILVKSSGDIVLLDFGAVGRISPELRAGMPVLMEAAITNDVDTLITTARQLGFLAPTKAADEIARKMIPALRAFVLDELKLKNLNLRNLDIDPFNNSMTSLARELGIRRMTQTFLIPEEWVLLNRTITLVTGLCSTLDPQFNPLDEVRPYVRGQLWKDKRSALRITMSVVRNKLGALASSLSEYTDEALRLGRAAVVSGLMYIGHLLS